ncbi:MAG: protein-glutamate O-methyltransferase CheR [Gammaproteobacteria bacterium]|jgi:chemotaxis protein methyltransferase CheR|nr:protein-glutamate O-methyltransferase CheR [Gammaproteobacteria bacterium]MBT3488094.1 protein-glutamate O-methyltransferase CheR [Gammaproteobacteria bacterium]MBT3719411.1 protein-glutamate O-methyltransferase CheR [Gammaproteobacteria bacterium]MBT3844246.1 protein-glutamate O-methyltransferase CheR [Gammaproteobacteria bacterium]MBT3893063.1 protein-glutamate O-methyltransferase CheR [Gammaproteobacteria bacterium]
MAIPTLEQLEILAEQIYELYGQDFRNYNRSSMGRRVDVTMTQLRIDRFEQFLPRVMEDLEVFQALMRNLSINVTSMFRDPYVFRYLREKVVPVLETYPHIRIWSAGMSTGAEPWSLSILLREAGLQQRSLIYATDFNPVAVRQAQQGSFPLENMAEYTRNYIRSGGTTAFSRYYTATTHLGHLDPTLKENIVFSSHNLVTDSVFNEFHLILCRNVLIYFDDHLTNQVLQLFSESLAERGYLVLGTKENLRFHNAGRYFETLHDKYKLFRKL